MNATEELYKKGQSLWLDNIMRELLTSGTLRHYIDEFSITGLTSNPTIFHHAIKDGPGYDAAIRKLAEQGKSGEDLFFRPGDRRPHPGRGLVPTNLRPDLWRGWLGFVGSLPLAGA